MTRRLLALPWVARVVCFSRDEMKQADMATRFTDPRMRFFLGDVRDRAALEDALQGIDTVIHAAALKRVDAAAYSSKEAKKTNVDGTVNVIDASIACGVRRVVFLSSDKATMATNFYGATKFLAEQIAIASNVYGYPRGTRIACTRYGNVLGSRGSVVHLWRDAVRRGEPLKLTHPEMSRFWMTIDQAVDLVFTALNRMDGGEVFLPKLPAMSLRDVAALVGGERYPVEVMGLRPGGEKLHEELLSPEEVSRTHDMGDVYAIVPPLPYWRSHTPDYGPLVPADFRYRSDTAPRLAAAAMREMLEAA